MELTSPTIIKQLLEKYGASPSKTMGQNFLIHQPTLNRIIEAADITIKDTVLEIGPGIGTLTQELAQKAKKVIAIEKDQAMVTILKETLHDFNNIEIVQGDVLKIFPPSLRTAPSGAAKQSSKTLVKIASSQKTPHNDELALPTHYKLIANIPYYITSPLIRMFLEIKNQPEYMVLMVQKEVAQRICAKPPRMSILAVSVQFYATAEIISSVSRGCFWPAPKVDSAIIKITPTPLLPLQNAPLASGASQQSSPSVIARQQQKQSNNNTSTEFFFRVVKAGFSQNRKQLINNLSTGLKKSKKEAGTWLLENGINPTQRAQTLSIDDWVNLVNNF